MNPGPILDPALTALMADSIEHGRLYVGLNGAGDMTLWLDRDEAGLPPKEVLSEFEVEPLAWGLALRGAFVRGGR